MRIRVYPPPFGDYGAIDEDGYVELPEGASLNELMKRLKLPFRRGFVLFCMVNHEKASLSHILKEGDEVSFFALVSGG